LPKNDKHLIQGVTWAEKSPSYYYCNAFDYACTGTALRLDDSLFSLNNLHNFVTILFLAVKLSILYGFGFTDVTGVMPVLMNSRR